MQRRADGHAARARTCGCALIEGNFDDAQTGVKEIFANEGLQGAGLKEAGVRLSSANSINLGRLAPQVAYYFKAYGDLLRRGVIRMGDAVNFAVPTGNFGDILAGEYARQHGPAGGETALRVSNAQPGAGGLSWQPACTTAVGNFSIPRRPPWTSWFPVIWNAACICSAAATVRWWRIRWANCSVRDIIARRNAVMKAFRRDFFGGYASDEDCFRAIDGLYRETNYLMDPHTAVAYAVARAYRESTGDNRPMVVLATASPYKFAPDVLRALGQEDAQGFAALRRLQEKTGVPIPKNLAELEGLPELHRDVIDISQMPEYVEK